MHEHKIRVLLYFLTSTTLFWEISSKCIKFQHHRIYIHVVVKHTPRSLTVRNTKSQQLYTSFRSNCGYEVQKVKIPHCKTKTISPTFKTYFSSPVSICQTYTVPSLQPTIIKSSKGRHLIVTTGKRCRDASTTHFLSVSPRSVTEWSLATLQTHFWIRGWKWTQS